MNKKKNVLGRLLKRVFQYYGIHCFIVLICIIGQAMCTVQGTLFMQTLIDDYVIPLMNVPSPDFSGLFHALTRMACIFGLGILFSYTYQRIMVTVTQGFLRDLRGELFQHMETLPIQYFDRHTHGDIMSIYTNDIDTLRQLISQSLPQLVSSSITIVTVFISMLTLNIPLTILSVIMLCVILFVSRKVGSLSSRYFIRQQQELGKVNGYIEEMISGQKVVKVFNHEKVVIDDFREINENLRDTAYQANKFANVLMPLTIQTGNVSYILCAIVGALMALSGRFDLTIGTLISFMTLNKNFNNPVGQISQQINAVAMAQAGAKRIFDLLDQESENDQGIVTLCRVKYVDGKMVETSERTGHWAWRHPRNNGDVELVEMKGDLRLENVDFGYVEDKMVLHNIDVFANPGEKNCICWSNWCWKDNNYKSY